MSSTVVAVPVFGCTFLGALAGLFLHASLPVHHLDADSKDVMKLVMGLIASMAALVLGLLISSAHRSQRVADRKPADQSSGLRYSAHEEPVKKNW